LTTGNQNSAACALKLWGRAAVAHASAAIRVAVEIAPAPPEVWKLAYKAGLAKRSIQPLKDAKVTVGHSGRPRQEIVVSATPPAFAHAC
jgi:hypothetical protein